MKITINGQSKHILAAHATGNMEATKELGPDRYEIDLGEEVVLALAAIDPQVDTAIAILAARYMARAGNTIGPFLQ